MLQKIAIVGGTHGNEMSGIQLVSNWIRHGIPGAFSDLDIDCLFANTAAMDANVRFLEEDLNRQFTPQKLSASPTCLEARLAQQLNETLGPKGQSDFDLVIDIHNTTSSMGATLIILEADEFHVQLARYVKHHMPEANVLVEDEKPPQEHPYLCTLGKRGLMIEVGAQPQGLLRADVYSLTEKMAEVILAFVQLYNQQAVPALPSCDAFRFIENIQYPLDTEGHRLAMIHPQLQDRDFTELDQGMPIFQHFDGNTEVWHGDTVYPHFINEAAYHKLHVAFATAVKTQL